MSTDNLTGTVLDGKYQIERLLGRGGMGAVYAGRHIQLDRAVAVKVVHANLSANETFLARFRREARATAKLEHPNAVNVYDFGSFEDGGAYLVMEMIEGETLRDLVIREGPLPVATALEYIRQAASAVAAAHARGIIHRDLKPDNMMLRSDISGQKTVKVVDFGLAKMLESATLLTGQFDTLGTPKYMAPEQFTGDFVDERADIYALGCVLFEFLAGRPPFLGTAMEVACKHTLKPVPTFESIGITIAPGIEEAIRHALAKLPEERTASVVEFMRELDAACQSSPVAGLQQAASGIVPAPPVAGAALRPPTQTMFGSIADGAAVGDEDEPPIAVKTLGGASVRAQEEPTPVTRVRANPATHPPQRRVVATQKTPATEFFPPSNRAIGPQAGRPAWVAPVVVFACVALFVVAIAFWLAQPNAAVPSGAPTATKEPAERPARQVPEETGVQPDVPAELPPSTPPQSTLTESPSVAQPAGSQTQPPAVTVSEPPPQTPDPNATSIESDGSTLRGQGTAPTPDPSRQPELGPDGRPRPPFPPPDGQGPGPRGRRPPPPPPGDDPRPPPPQ